MMLNVVKSLPKLEDLSMWSSLEHVGDMASDNLKNVGSLKLGGLNYSSLLTDMCSLIGSQLTSLKIETVHCEVDVSLVGKLCDNLEELSVINARVEGTNNIQDHRPMFPRLKLLYFFLVQYRVVGPPLPLSPTSPAGVPNPSTGQTALHTILRQGPKLESVQVSGTGALTDSCIDSILGRNPLTKLRRLMISQCISPEQQVVPLTSRSVVRIQNSCPYIQTIGDLKHWAVTPTARRKLIRGWRDKVS